MYIQFLLLRISKRTRDGDPDGIQLERYVEALNCQESGLTYPALVGLRKQSVEQLSLFTFMEKRGYINEAEYIYAVYGWRQACDQRGLSELERCRFNYRILNYILVQLMPLYDQVYDFSLMEVNRYVNV